MNETLMRRLFGAAVFFTTLLIYLLTVQSNVSFWDCGEFIASSFLLQVPHPPGTPFFLLVGRLFSMIPFGDNVAFSVNMISVFSSAFTALFLYLVVVKLIENYTKEEAPTLSGRFATHIAGVIGALSLAFADTFWFNAVEAEVYAFATFFIGAVTYLMMLWNEKADEIDNEKYLVMIAYLIGLSTGVHLMSTLAIVPIVMVVTFRKFISDEAILKSTSKIFAGHFAVGLLVAILLWSQETDVRPPSSDIYKAFDSRFLMFVAAVVGIYAIAVWKKIFQWNSIYLPVLIGGVALIITYPGMVKYIPKLLYAVGGNSYFLNIFVVLAILGALIYFVHWARIHNKNSQRLIAKTVLFLILGYTSYSMIMIRSNQDTPINLNSPTDMEGLVSYLSREQYGDFPTFKRRYSQEPQHQGIYENYSSDLDFFWNYQMNHMFNRYVMWNYVGRVSTVQDSGVDWSQLFGIPFLLGLFGVYYHFRRDWKMGIVFLVMFVFLGWLTAFYQNQQNPQPRERDYFYTGAFFVFSIWVGLGVKGVVELLANQLKESAVTKPAVASVLILSFAFVPGNMLLENFNRNDRSRNFVPWDYSYNMLQSVAPNAVIFTNGDNDTFPLWYLQDVEGVRQDVRIANLSLLNTPWYIKQLKNTEPHGAEKIKMTLSDAQIDRIGPQQWNTKEVSIPVTPEAFEQIGITDTALTKKTEIRWKMPHTAQFGNVTAVRTQDLVALDLIRANNWERPIYFAVTSSDQAKLGLNDYLKMEGMAFRLVPIKRPGNMEFVDAEIMKKQLFEEPDGYSKDYQPGFKFRGLNDPTIFFDNNHQRLVGNYRNSFLRLALHYLFEAKDYPMAVKTLDMMETKVPRSIIEIDYRLLYDISSMYYTAGALEQYEDLAREVEVEALRRIADNEISNGNYNPYRIILDIYQNLEEYDKAIDILEKLKVIAPTDKQVDVMLERMRRLSKQDASEVQQQTLDIENNDEE